jgi:Pro-kumamolisin, activation domain
VFSRATLADFARVVAIAGEVHVYIHGSLTAGRNVDIYPAFRRLAGHLTISVSGSDERGRPAASFGGHSAVSAVLAVPHGTLSFADHVRAVGAFVGFDIALGADVDVDFQSGFPADASGQPGTQKLSGYFGPPPNPSVAAVAGPVPSATVVNLSIGLPVRDPAGLRDFVNHASDPTHPNYRRYLTPGQFTATYGATASDYQAVVNWAAAHGLNVVATYPNNLLVDVSGTAAQVEEALYVNLVHRLRRDGSQFVTVDREPSLDLGVPILHISGFSDFVLPKHSAFNGSAGGNGYWGWDFRNAYLGIGTACSGLTGAGQVIGLFELDGFVQSDLAGYAAKAGAATAQNPAMSVVSPLVVGSASLGSGQTEVTLDIEIAQSMAPGATIIVFEGGTGISGHGDSVLHAMATSATPLTVASSSWTYGWNENAEQAVTQMAAQGVSFFQSTGDNGGIADPTDNRDIEHQTLVGGTALQTNPLVASPPATVSYPNPYYAGDTTWSGSSGGFMSGNTQDCWPWPSCQSVSTGIPGYQTGVDMSNNGGSTAFRNFPDVSMDAFFTAFVNGSPNGQVGTSEATPMWAGFMALVNQQASLNGVARAGFANPVLYAIGLTASQPQPNLYSQSFNDVTGGSNGRFTSVTGYDLTSGWGTPKCGLLTQLASPAPLNPQTFTLIEVHVNNGDDGIRDNSITSYTVNFNGGIAPFTDTFHPQNTTGWDDKGVVHDLTHALPVPMAPSAINDVTFTLTQTSCLGCTSDNWTIGGLDVRLLNPTGPVACIFHGEATQLGRLTESNPTATFTPGGCPSAQVLVPPPAQPVTEVIFIFGTGDDDLRSGSELDVAFLKPDSTVIETGVLKAQGAPLFDNNTQNTVVYKLTTGPHMLSDFGSIVVSMNNSGNDEWHIFGINVMADSPSGPQNCLFNLQGEPLQVLNQSTPAVTLKPLRNGCP